MKKKDYFLKALNAKRHYSREWMLRAFTVVISEPTDGLWELFSLRHTAKVVEVLMPSPGNYPESNWIALEDCEPYEIPFTYHESTGPLKKGDVINLDRDLADSTWGDIIVNARVLGYACGDAIPFMEGPFTPSDIEKVFIKALKDEPADKNDWIPGELYPYHWLRVGKAVGDLDGFEIFIPSVTEHSLQPYPGLKEDRDRLLGEHTEDELMDPVVQTKIQTELVDKYKAYLKGDPAEGFIFKDKTISTSFKQMFLIHGPEAGFSEGGIAKLVPTSLDEGINTDYYPEMMNSLRAGAFFRGAMTALAGTDVDLFGRIFQGTQVSLQFCGTKETLNNVMINDRYTERWIDIEGGRVQLDEENLAKYKGTKQSLYDPSYCKAKENDICLICIGGRLARYPTSLGSAVTEKQSVLMSVMMASAHAKQLKTIPLKEDWLE